jgi:hypothetical protein
MTTLVIDRSALPEQLSSLFRSPRVVVTQKIGGGEAVFTPAIDPADYDNDTDYLNAIPGMMESIIEGCNTPLSECVPVSEVWPDV